MAAASGKWALVTGATGGLGRAFCASLARRGFNLVLSARNEEALRALAGELSGAYGIEVVSEAIDLGEAGAGARLKGAIDRRGIAIETLVNNAGFGLRGKFADKPVDAELGMVDVNIRALTELAHLYANAMAAAGGGHILLVASTAAFQPIPGYAVYAASKAYVLSLGHALHVELSRRKVVVSVTCPGPTETEFWSRAGHRLNRLAGSVMMKPEAVVEIGLDTLYRGKPSVVTGLANKLMTLSTRLVSRSLQALGASVFMGERK